MTLSLPQSLYCRFRFLMITIPIISKAQIFKKLLALYKEHDGSGKLVNVHVQKSNKQHRKQTYTLSHTLSLSLSLSLTHTYTMHISN